jgi:hypothetical protein
VQRRAHALDDLGQLEALDLGELMRDDAAGELATGEDALALDLLGGNPGHRRVQRSCSMTTATGDGAELSPMMCARSR